MSESKTVSFGCDHAAFEYKEFVVKALEDAGYSVIDHGTYSADSTDYPDHVHPVADDVECERAELGIIMCGSGNGAAMTANKHQGIRAAIAWTPELAALARQHNNANVLSIPARFVSEEMAGQILKAFLESAFEGGRHARRVGKIDLKETSQNC